LNFGNHKGNVMKRKSIFKKSRSFDFGLQKSRLAIWIATIKMDANEMLVIQNQLARTRFSQFTWDLRVNNVGVRLEENPASEDEIHQKSTRRLDSRITTFHGMAILSTQQMKTRTVFVNSGSFEDVGIRIATWLRNVAFVFVSDIGKSWYVLLTSRCEICGQLREKI